MVARNQLKHLELAFAMITITFPLWTGTYKHGHLSYTVVLELFKLPKEKSFFQARQLCYGAILHVTHD